MKKITQNNIIEFTFKSAKIYKDPFNNVELTVIFAGADGKERNVPAFWAGKSIWKVRFSSPIAGKYRYRTICSVKTDSGLNYREGCFEVVKYKGSNPLYKNGRLCISKDRRHFEHAGKPFFWLADTWWMALCKNLKFADFKKLIADRNKKGFTVIQVVAGLYPEIAPFDKRGMNEAGFPWEKGFKSINPGYFDVADKKIKYAIEKGIVPCIVGCWGYYLKIAGESAIKKHWRYMIARWGALPVVWCAAGESEMAYYPEAHRMFKTPKAYDKYKDKIRPGWTRAAKYIRETDPFNNILTIHPTDYGRKMVEDSRVIDFEMLQSGHSSFYTLRHTVKMLQKSLKSRPVMPVLVAEACYEGIFCSSFDEVQRFLFWSTMLLGGAGYTYGADGLWNFNSKKAPFGRNVSGISYGNRTWQEAYEMPGGKHIGIAKKLLANYDWNKLEPHPEWVGGNDKVRDELKYLYAAGIPKEVRMIYIPWALFWAANNPVSVKGIERGICYSAFYFDPRTGKETYLGNVSPDNKGTWQSPRPPSFGDWVLVIKRKR